MSKAQKLLNTIRKNEASAPPPDAEEFCIYVMDGDEAGTIKFSKYNGKWTERVVDGDIKNVGHKTYQSYLKPSDIMTWIKQDFDSAQWADMEESDDGMTGAMPTEMDPVPMSAADLPKLSEFTILDNGCADAQPTVDKGAFEEQVIGRGDSARDAGDDALNQMAEKVQLNDEIEKQILDLSPVIDSSEDMPHWVVISYSASKDQAESKKKVAKKFNLDL